MLTIVDYADPYTKRVLQPGQQQSVALITPDAFHVMGKVLDGVTGRSKGPGLQLIKLKMLQLSELQVRVDASAHTGDGSRDCE